MPSYSLNYYVTIYWSNQSNSVSKILPFWPTKQSSAPSRNPSLLPMCRIITRLPAPEIKML